MVIILLIMKNLLLAISPVINMIIFSTDKIYLSYGHKDSISKALAVGKTYRFFKCLNHRSDKLEKK